ncbi:MORC family CW-type zinc finger protein 3-like isoform X1 [Denticeps clupeoides]|uniref:MORC family CW-type zinc finger protein 3-like isoform X1 n=1 Tax=Denticeps clupeoides TaxID=299321 RepID=UPI0010A31F74|nr:MORC family CW-type zinc finger protein 3-like isoform X1 [Denticeps clupeoides]
MATFTEEGVPLSALNPNDLHSNSTSHTWPFSAIAQLIDNAYDPDVCAKQLWIDKTQIKGVDCLTFMDNGAGMDYDAMYKLLSFGFSDKQSVEGHAAVGMYGNGFKSGSMRLGKDVIVFSKRRNSMCVGMLSQTYLKKIKATNITVPIVTYNRVGSQSCIKPEDMASMQKILKYSLFQTEEAILSELKAINSTTATNTSGTRIIIWNLRRTESGKLEFDFDTERYDIRIPDDMSDGTQTKFRRQERNTPTVPDTDFSLRAYCSILYLKPRMQIIIRGQKVKTQLVSKSLAHVIMDKYKPNFLKQAVSITFGYSTMGKDNYGVMMYHKNRLIKAYERVGCQLRANTKGVGVIGVIECNFLKPTHNMQDFDDTDEYRKTMSSLGAKLEDYWKVIQHKRNTEDPNCPPVEDVEKQPDQNWIQCDECLKWRKLPVGINIKQLPENWFCHMNLDPYFRSCEKEAEKEDSEDEQPTNKKTYKQVERRNKEMIRHQEQLQKEQQLNQMAALAKENEALQKQKESLRKKLKRTRASVQLTACPGVPEQLPANSPSSHEGSSSMPDNSTPIRKRTSMAGNGAKRIKPNWDLKANVKTVNNPKGQMSYNEILMNANTMAYNSATMENTETVGGSIGTAEHGSMVHSVEDNAQFETPEFLMELISEHSLTPLLFAEGESSARDLSVLPGLCEERLLLEGQAQQGHQMELLSTSGRERDNYKSMVDHLTSQVEDLQKQLFQKEVKKAQAEHGTQTDDVEKKDYRAQFQHATEVIKKLKKERDAFINERRKMEEKSKQVQSSMENEQAATKECLGEASLWSQLNQLNEIIDDLVRATEEFNCRYPGVDMAQNTEVILNEEDRRAATASNVKEMEVDGRNRQTDDNSSHKSDAELKLTLNQLRHRVGCLLASIIPTLDLQQVNYDSNVIDEILDKVLKEISHVEKESS